VSVATAIRQWELSSFQIEAKLRAYFPDETLSTAWRDYSDSVRQFFLALTQPVAQRPGALLTASRRIGFHRQAAKAVYFRALMIIQRGAVVNIVVSNLRRMTEDARRRGRRASAAERALDSTRA
jgi:hypothetical protein